MVTYNNCPYEQKVDCNVYLYTIVNFFFYIYRFVLIFAEVCDRIILRRKIEYMHISEEVLGKSVFLYF